MTKKIFLSGAKGKGLFALVDDEDYERVSRHKWYLCQGYAKMAHGPSMHRFIMNPSHEMTIDHLNFNRLDNRKANLRECTLTENVKRKRSKGYTWDKRHNYWSVNTRGVTRCYHSEEEAIEAVRLIKSGRIPEKRSTGGVQKMRPKNISRNRFHSYFFQCRLNGVRYTKYGFKTIQDAVAYRDSFYKEKGIN